MTTDVVLPMSAFVVRGEQGFEEFYTANVRGLVVQLYAYLGDLDAAETVAQEALTRAAMRWRKLSKRDEPTAWVRREGWRLAADRLKKLPDRPSESSLANALKALPPRQRQFVILHYLARLSPAQIAQEQDVDLTTVQDALTAARAAITSQLTLNQKGN